MTLAAVAILARRCDLRYSISFSENVKLAIITFAFLIIFFFAFKLYTVTCTVSERFIVRFLDAQYRNIRRSFDSHSLNLALDHPTQPAAYALIFIVHTYILPIFAISPIIAIVINILFFNKSSRNFACSKTS
jgi:C4-dicarboxylate transporter